jgi:hypothetical protein
LASAVETTARYGTARSALIRQPFDGSAPMCNATVKKPAAATAWSERAAT